MNRKWSTSFWNIFSPGQRDSNEENRSSNVEETNPGMLGNVTSYISRSMSDIAGYFTGQNDSVNMAPDPVNDPNLQPEIFQISESQYQVVKNSKYIQDLKDKETKMCVECDDSVHSITIYHPKQRNKQLKKEMDALLKGVHKIPLKLKDGKEDFLERDTVSMFVEEKLERLNCQIVTENVGDKCITVIVAENKYIAIEADKIIKSCLVLRKFKKSNASKNRLSALMTSLNKQHEKKILISSSNDYMVVLCTSDIEKDIALKIEHDLKEKDIREEFTIGFQKYRYFETFEKENMRDVAMSFDVSVEFATDIRSERCKIVLSGVDSDVYRMKRHLEGKMESIMTNEVPITDTVCCSFLRQNTKTFCTELSKTTNCIVDAELVDDGDNSDGMETRVAGKCIMLSCAQHTSALIVVQMLRSEDSPAKVKKRRLPDILQKANLSGNLEQLHVPFKGGCLQKQKFEANTFALLRKVDNESASSMAVQLESGFNETEEMIFREILKLLLRHFQEKCSSLHEITFHLENDEYKLGQLKKIITECAMSVKQQDYNEKYVVRLTGKRADVQRINVLHEIQDKRLNGRTRNNSVVSPFSSSMDLDNYGVNRMQVCSDKGHTPASRKESVGSDSYRRESDSDSGVFHLKSKDNRTATVDVAETILSSSTPSIGLIHIDLPNNEEINGTCFRVGDKYIMTTLHTLTGKLDMIKHTTFRKRKQKVFDKDVYVIFAYKKAAHRDSLFKHRLQYPPAYINHALDVAIIELKTEKGLYLPKPLRLARQLYVPTTLTFIYHSKGDVQILDSACRVVDTSDPSIQEAKRFANAHYSNYGDGYREILSGNFFLCHSSAEPGASGAPGMISDISVKEQSVVFCFMSEGSPSFFHNLPMEDQNDYPKDLMFEKAVRMDAVHDALRRDDRDLCEELFHPYQQHESMDL